RALADATEHRLSPVALLHVVDQLHDDDGLPDAGAAKQADLSTFDERSDQVDDFDARLEHLGFGLEVRELRRRTVNWPPLDVIRNRRTVVHWLPDHVENSAECRFANRHRYRAAGVFDLHAAHDGVGRRHRDRAHLVAADVLL